MVLSGSKRVSYLASTSNQNSGGGSKKAGLQSQVGIGAYAGIHRGGLSANGARYGGTGLIKMLVTQAPTNQSRPTGVRPSIWMKYNF
tara:strand:- start:518 stop:778 length:261 start_codon:yes stop_codon:yes gene_type:complete